MTNEPVGPVSALVRTLRSIPGAKWEPGETDRAFSAKLSRLDDALLVELERRVALLCERRPSLAELFRMAAELASPLPTHADALEEVLRLVRSRGRNAVRVAGSNLWVEGEPTDLSHPLILRVVRDVGGWAAVCETENLGVFRAQWERTYKDRADQWFAQVVEALCLPVASRPPALFPGFGRRALGAEFALPSALPAPAAAPTKALPGPAREPLRLEGRDEPPVDRVAVAARVQALGGRVGFPGEAEKARRSLKETPPALPAAGEPLRRVRSAQ